MNTFPLLSRNSIFITVFFSIIDGTNFFMLYSIEMDMFQIPRENLFVDFTSQILLLIIFCQ